MEKKNITREYIIQTLKELDAKSEKTVGRSALVQKQINQYHMGIELLGDRTGIEAALRRLRLIVATALQGLGNASGNLPVGINHQHPQPAGVKHIGGNIVNLHKTKQFGCGNSSVS